jgi:nucleoside-diphosphate-sugar epimerase
MGGTELILLTGASGYTGRRVLPLLVAKGYRVRCLLRASSDTSAAVQAGAEVHVADLEADEGVKAAFSGVRYLVHLAHIRFGPLLARCADPNLEHAVALSSLRLFSKVEDESVSQVRQAEADLKELAPAWTILRPSMIYGPGEDRNLSRLGAYMRRRRLFPVFGSGAFLQQPVFVEDVAGAVLAALQRPKIAASKAYALAGPQSLTYVDLLDAVGAAVGRPPVKVCLPVAPILAIARFLGYCGLSLGLDAAQIRRLQEDKSYDISAARTELDFDPIELGEGLRRSHHD